MLSIYVFEENTKRETYPENKMRGKIDTEVNSSYRILSRLDMFAKLAEDVQTGISPGTRNCPIVRNQVLPMLHLKPVFKPQRRDTTTSKRWELES